jgi:hypothetical protein
VKLVFVKTALFVDSSGGMVVGSGGIWVWRTVAETEWLGLQHGTRSLESQPSMQRGEFQDDRGLIARACARDRY